MRERLLEQRRQQKQLLPSLSVAQVQDAWIRKHESPSSPGRTPSATPERLSLAELMKRIAAIRPAPAHESPQTAAARVDAENVMLLSRGIDLEFLPYSFETMSSTLPARYHQAAALVARLLEPGKDEPRLLGLSGPTGRGKSGMAAALGRRAIQRGMSFFYTTPHLYLSTWDAARAPKRIDIRKNYVNADVVIFDESQQRRIVDQRGYLEDEFMSLIDKRQANRRATLLITNLEPATFVANVGEPMWRRMREKGGIICADWDLIREPSFRMPTVC